MNTNKKTVMLVKMALVVAIYVAVTGVLAPISFGNIQFRLSEVLILLVFIDSAYIAPLTLGCFIANFLFSSMVAFDVVFGTLATFITLILMWYTKKALIKEDESNLGRVAFLSSIWASLVNGIIIGAELYYALKLPFWLSAIQVAIGEFVVVSIVGVIVFKFLYANDSLMDKLKVSVIK